MDDAITGNKLDLMTQLIHVSMDAATASDGGISGVQRADYISVGTVPQLARLLRASSPARAHGTHQEQDVLIQAGAGTGKTWSMRQLTLNLAKFLERSAEPVPLVPLLIPVQRLALLMRAFPGNAELLNQDLVRFFIHHAFSGDEQLMLLMAYDLRALLPLIDGIDEGAGLKHTIEDFIMKQLAPAGFRVVLTSRPEGVRLQRYSDEFVIMSLRSLSDAQQNELVLKQIGQSEIFERLTALGRKRREQPASSLAENDEDIAFFRAKYGEMYGAGLTEVRWANGLLLTRSHCVGLAPAVTYEWPVVGGRWAASNVLVPCGRACGRAGVTPRRATR